MAFVKVGNVSELAPNSAMEVTVEGNPYAICNADGKVYAMWGVCPHQGGPLGEGVVNDGRVMCPWHAWEFDCRSGENDFDPVVKVATFPAKVEGGDILIDIPSA